MNAAQLSDLRTSFYVAVGKDERRKARKICRVLLRESPSDEHARWEKWRAALAGERDMGGGLLLNELMGEA